MIRYFEKYFDINDVITKNFINDIREKSINEIYDYLYARGGDKLVIAFIYVMSKTFDDSHIIMIKNSYSYDYALRWQFNGEAVNDIFGYNTVDYGEESTTIVKAWLTDCIQHELLFSFHFNGDQTNDFISMIEWHID